MTKPLLTKAQEVEALRLYQVGLKAGRRARKLTPDFLSIKHDISTRSIRRIAGKGLAHAFGSAAYQDISHNALTALWADISERDRQRSIRAEHSVQVISDKLGVCPIKFQARMDYLTKKEVPGRGPVRDSRPETPDFVRAFVTMPAINPGQSMGYYGHG